MMMSRYKLHSYDFLYGKFKVHVQSDHFQSHLTILKILKIESNFSVFCKVEIFSWFYEIKFEIGKISLDFVGF